VFENLPEIKQSNLEAFIDYHDFERITKDVNKYISQLREENPSLARAVEGSAATAVELDCLEFTPHLKEMLLGNCVVAIMLTLQLIDRELGAAKLQRMCGELTVQPK